MKIKSQSVVSPHSCEAIYYKISDLKHLEELRPLLEERQVELIPLDSDHCKLKAQVMHISAEIGLVVSERTPIEEVRYKIEHEMLPATISIRLTPQGVKQTELIVSIEAPINPFVADMIQPRLKEAVQQISQILGQLDYD